MKVIALYFIVTMLIGFFVVYVISPEPIIILKQPNPKNASDITFVDDNNVCYRYGVEETTCSDIGDVHLYE